MNLPRLTESMLSEQSTATSFERGMAYYEAGMVSSLVLSGEILHAEIEGSQHTPYQVQVRFDAGKVAEAYCDCPYDWGGWCKHIVAVLLTCIHAPEMIEEKTSLTTALADLSQEDLLALLTKMIELNPKLLDQIEGQLILSQSSKATTPQRNRKKTGDSAPFRRQVRDILHSLNHMRPSEAYWHVGSVVNEIGQVLDQVHTLVKTGDGRGALPILEAITDEYIRGWLYLDDSDGFAGGLFSDLGRVWAEAILSANLTTEESKYWADQLTAWQAEVEEYGIDEGFDAAQAAALQGWNDSALQNILQGKSSDSLENTFISSWYEENLIEAHLNVLEYQKRYQEYLNLAKAKGQLAKHLTMLVRLNRIPEAVEYGKKFLTTAADTLAFAKALQEAGASVFALEIAELGLSFQGVYLYQLAGWLRDLAAQEENSLLALRAGIVAFKEQPALDDYLLVSKLSAKNWPKIRPDL